MFPNADTGRFFLILWGINSILLMFLLIVLIVRNMVDLENRPRR